MLARVIQGIEQRLEVAIAVLVQGEDQVEYGFGLRGHLTQDDSGP
jgi:hypothetical protein